MSGGACTRHSLLPYELQLRHESGLDLGHLSSHSAYEGPSGRACGARCEGREPGQHAGRGQGGMDQGRGFVWEHEDPVCRA